MFYHISFIKGTSETPEAELVHRFFEEAVGFNYVDGGLRSGYCSRAAKDFINVFPESIVNIDYGDITTPVYMVVDPTKINEEGFLLLKTFLNKKERFHYKWNNLTMHKKEMMV